VKFPRFLIIVSYSESVDPRNDVAMDRQDHLPVDMDPSNLKHKQQPTLLRNVYLNTAH